MATKAETGFIQTEFDWMQTEAIKQRVIVPTKAVIYPCYPDAGINGYVVKRSFRAVSTSISPHVDSSGQSWTVYQAIESVDLQGNSSAPFYEHRVKRFERPGFQFLVAEKCLTDPNKKPRRGRRSKD